MCEYERNTTSHLTIKPKWWTYSFSYTHELVVIGSFLLHRNMLTLVGALVVLLVVSRIDAGMSNKGSYIEVDLNRW